MGEWRQYMIIEAVSRENGGNIMGEWKQYQSGSIIEEGIHGLAVWNV